MIGHLPRSQLSARDLRPGPVLRKVQKRYPRKEKPVLPVVCLFVFDDGSRARRRVFRCRDRTPVPRPRPVQAGVETARFTHSRSHSVDHRRNRVVRRTTNEEDHERRFPKRIHAGRNAKSLHARFVHPCGNIRAVRRLGANNFRRRKAGHRKRRLFGRERLRLLRVQYSSRGFTSRLHNPRTYSVELSWEGRVCRPGRNKNHHGGLSAIVKTRPHTHSTDPGHCEQLVSMGIACRCCSLHFYIT